MRATRRVVTGHDANGKAIVTSDGPAENVKLRQATGGIVSTLLWVTDSTPCDCEPAGDPAVRDIGVAPPAGGSVLRIVDFPPVQTGAAGIDNAAMKKEMGLGHDGGGSPARHPFTHRTRSVDYALVLEGEIDMLLDDSEVHLKAGDVLVQLATNHAWVNTSDKPCRIAFVLIDAKEPDAWRKGR
ncbi:MAG: cupin domain-containing protein [Hyphomicrobiaceae bacterium]